MKLHEYQSKLIFSKHGIPIPKGQVASTSSEAKQIAVELGGRVVIKSQVLAGGRGKAGGIRLAKSPKEAEELATLILGMEIQGYPVHKVLIDEAVTFSKEIYLGITVDRAMHCPSIIASDSGGMNIEEVARRFPEKIIKMPINPLIGLRVYQARDIASSIDLPRLLWRSFIDIAQGLWAAFCDCDASLAEINPLVITTDQRLLALDGKLVVDDNSLFRHIDLAEMRDMEVEIPAEIDARKYGLTYIKMDGEIGCMVNGAGLAMATMDMIKQVGGKPANFLDIGGGAGAEKVAASMRILLSEVNIRSILINIFGGLTRCDEVAKGILSVLEEMKPKIPIIVRLVGTNSEEGLKILADAHLRTAETLFDAAKDAVGVIEMGGWNEHIVE